MGEIAYKPKCWSFDEIKLWNGSSMVYMNFIDMDRCNYIAINWKHGYWVDNLIAMK